MRHGEGNGQATRLGVAGLVDLRGSHRGERRVGEQRAVQAPHVVGADHGVGVEEQDVGVRVEPAVEREVDPAPNPPLRPGSR